ncbi:hypothetical protein [Tautonia plasticadhaerens]|uniref:Uncharacterized protein n=1 Tax=Tautonia plasticadhaerens TaxID=2527974 RepID=A0A518HAM0_9BACT|nr:hypothetical protein [Tautonia plasticadhaerens]QDV37900.1 hypothetical protein ElP_58470 [Tautonia plasticadhaerens]
MGRTDARRNSGHPPAVESLEGRQLLSGGAGLPPGYAAGIASQSYQAARAAPQSPSPHTTRVSVATDRPGYSPGQPIRLTVTQAVAGQTPVNTGTMADAEVIVSRRGRELWRSGDDRGPAVATHQLVTLQPGQSRSTTIAWDGRARDGSVVTGPVEIRAVVDRVASPPKVVQIGGAGPSSPSASPGRPGADRPSPGPGQSTIDAARIRQLRERQARAMAEAARPRLPDSPAGRSPWPGGPAARRWPGRGA